jgi:DNA-binding CsgD family transcriptional regulator
MDVWLAPFLRKAAGEMAFGPELCPVEKLKKTEYYNDYLLKFDLNLFCAIATVRDQRMVEHISLYQSWKSNSPSKETVDLVRLILPHMQTALDVRRRLGSLAGENRNFEDALDQMRQGVILFDEYGSCVFLNRVARELARKRDGVYLTQNRLYAVDLRESQGLQGLVKNAVSTGTKKDARAAGAILISRRFGRALHVVISPFSSERTSFQKRAIAIALISDPEPQASRQSEVLGRLYFLTPAEIGVVELLGSGLSLTESAAVKQVSKETIRSQLKSILDKTGARRQSDLIRLLGTMPTFIPPRP